MTGAACTRPALCANASISFRIPYIVIVFKLLLLLLVSGSIFSRHHVIALVNYHTFSPLLSRRFLLKCVFVSFLSHHLALSFYIIIYRIFIFISCSSSVRLMSTISLLLTIIIIRFINITIVIITFLKCLRPVPCFRHPSSYASMYLYAISHFMFPSFSIHIFIYIFGSFP